MVSKCQGQKACCVFQQNLTKYQEPGQGNPEEGINSVGGQLSAPQYEEQEEHC